MSEAAPDEALAEVLERARTLGFLGPGPVTPHIDHAVRFATLLHSDDEGPCVDLGSGGGVPGLGLARLLPLSRWILVDAMAKRARFLEEAVLRLGLTDRVEVVCGRAEDVGRQDRRRNAHQTVVARSFAAPPVLAECAAPLLRTGGTMVVSEPPAEPAQGGHRRDRWPERGLATLGLEVDGWWPGPPAFVRLRQTRPCPERFPRAVGVPAKRPLW